MSHYGLTIQMELVCAFVLAVTMKGITAVNVTSISCGDICSATTGTPYTLTCTLSGTIQTGVLWKRGIDQELSCNSSGVCFPASTGYASGRYPTPSTAELTITSFDFSRDGGNWECLDGTDQPKSCTLNAIESRSVKLDITCDTSGNDHVVICSLDDHGTPPITLELRDGSSVIASTAADRRLQQTISDASGKTYTCAVSGPDSLCTTPKSVNITCQGATDDSGPGYLLTKRTTLSEHSVTLPDYLLGLVVCAIVFGIILIIIVVVLLYLHLSNPKYKKPACVMAVILIIISLLFITLLFVLYKAYSDAKFIAAVTISVVGCVVGGVAMGHLFWNQMRGHCCPTHVTNEHN